MADLDAMLLAIAGRKNGKRNNDPKRRAVPAAVGDSSSDDEDDKGKMPLKKRFESDNHKDEDEGSELSFGSDLYKDEEDRQRLLAMSELDREMILHERGEKLDTFRLRKKADARKAEQQHQQPQQQHQQPQQQQQQPQPQPQQKQSRNDGPPSSRMRSSGRETSKSSKAHALNELVARRQKAQDTDQQRRRSREAAAASARPKDRKGRSVSPSSNSDADSEDEEESSRESNRSRSEGLPSDDDEDERGGRDDLPSREDIRSITIRRSKLFKWFMEPFFEEVIVGCFVRIGIGMSSSGTSIYRLCMVKNVDAKDPDKQYKFENKVTHKYLNCTFGDAAGRWQMVRASDQPPTDEEIDAWKAAVAKSGSPGLTKEEVKDKQEALEKVGQFVYSAAAVKQMLQEKKMAAARTSTAALEKERLLKQLATAESKGDQEQIERINEKLRELETKQKIKNEKAERIEMMNRRNRFENFKNASELKPVNSMAKMGEAGYDPFSRRWTRSQNYYKADAPKTAAEQSERDKTERAGTSAEGLEDLAKAGSARLDGEQYSKMFSLHDFPLSISLEPIERYKSAGAAYMDRKRAMEARYGVKVENNDGRRHSLTLTVNDYKRRRGLL